jgi:hypothetical protein
MGLMGPTPLKVRLLRDQGWICADFLLVSEKSKTVLTLLSGVITGLKARNSSCDTELART